MDPLQEIDPFDQPEGWRLITLTSLFLDGKDCCVFVRTHSKACGLVGLTRHIYEFSLRFKMCIYVSFHLHVDQTSIFAGRSNNMAESGATLAAIHHSSPVLQKDWTER